MAVGLARTLRVGELVELIDVGLGNHDVDGREHVWAPRGIVFDGVSLFDEAGVRPAILVRGACQRGWRRRDPACSNKKSARRAWQLCQALDGYSLSLEIWVFNRVDCQLHRSRNPAIAKKSGCLNRFHYIANQRSQFEVCWVSCSLGVDVGGCGHVVGQPGAERLGI